MAAPLPPQHRLRALAELPGLATEDWRDWLRHGIEMWVHATKISDRVDAFAPVVLRPREDGPFQLAPFLRRLPLQDAAGRLEDALAEEIATWSYTDGIDRGVFLLNLAGWFGCRGIVAALAAMLARPNHSGARGKLQLATALGFVICKRTDPVQAIALARRMSDRGLAERPVIARIIAYGAVAAPHDLPRLLDEFLPDWNIGGFTTSFARLLADQLVDRLGLFTVAELLLGPTADRFAIVGALLRTYRLHFEYGEDIRVTDRITLRHVTTRSRAVSEETRHASKEHAEALFRFAPVGELVSDIDLVQMEARGQG